MSYNISNSFLEEFDYLFHPFLQQQGSQLMQAVTQDQVTGESKYIRQAYVGEAFDKPDRGSITEYTEMGTDRRRLMPHEFVCPIMLDQFDLIKQGTPDPMMLAQQAANSCGKKIDKIILDGIGGVSYTAANGAKYLTGANEIAAGSAGSKVEVFSAYEETNTIPWNDATLGGNANDTTLTIQAGLNTGKIAKAVQKLQSKFNYGPIICVASSRALAQLRADPRMASSDFNDIHSFMAGQNTPYAGVSAFVASELMPGGKSVVSGTNGAAAKSGNDPTGVDIEYAYVYSMNQIVLGSNMPLTLDSGQNPERYMNQVLMYRGAYDCTRMFEEAVVRIEIPRSASDIKEAAFVR